MQTSFVHNLRWLFFVSAVVVLVATGFSCGGGDEKAGTAPRKTGDARVSSDAGATLDAGITSPTSGQPITWTTYHNERLGISIPYPEGWYVEESEDTKSVAVFESKPPAFSDAPARVYFEIKEVSLVDEVGSFPNQLEAVDVQRSGGRSMKRIVFLTDAELPDERSTSYVWEQGSRLFELTGAEGDQVVEYIVDHLEVLP